MNLDSEESAIAAFEQIMWPDQRPVCPHCRSQKGSGRIGGNNRTGLRYCKACKRQFRVTVGTPFARSHLPMQKLFQICQLLSVGVNPHQIHVELGITYATSRRVTKMLKENRWLARRVVEHMAWVAADEGDLHR